MKKKNKLLTVQQLIDLLNNCEHKSAPIKLHINTKDDFRHIDLPSVPSTDVDYDYENDSIFYYIDVVFDKKLSELI